MEIRYLVRYVWIPSPSCCRHDVYPLKVTVRVRDGKNLAHEGIKVAFVGSIGEFLHSADEHLLTLAAEQWVQALSRQLENLLDLLPETTHMPVLSWLRQAVQSARWNHQGTRQTPTWTILLGVDDYHWEHSGAGFRVQLLSRRPSAMLLVRTGLQQLGERTAQGSPIDEEHLCPRETGARPCLMSKTMASL